MKKLFGTHFLLKLMERSEKGAIECYRRLIESVKENEIKKELEEILKDEIYHENELIKDVEDIRVKYLGYIALGLADAVVEITGVHTGFLGATANTILAGLAGIIVGFSASLSMSGAAYLQAKHDPSVSPPVSAGVTGLAYLISVVLLALPYFIIHNIWGAFVTSLIVAMIILGTFIYYSSVIQDKDFWREYVETVTLLMLTAFGSFAFGKIMEIIIGANLFGH
jgi:VIT1/CCC1 family predicted Fe2+/Mn2+ transporter